MSWPTTCGGFAQAVQKQAKSSSQSWCLSTSVISTAISSVEVGVRVEKEAGTAYKQQLPGGLSACNKSFCACIRHQRDLCNRGSQPSPVSGSL